MLVESIGVAASKLRVFSRRTSLTKTVSAFKLTRRAVSSLVVALPRLWSRQGVQESASELLRTPVTGAENSHTRALAPLRLRQPEGGTSFRATLNSACRHARGGDSNQRRRRGPGIYHAVPRRLLQLQQDRTKRHRNSSQERDCISRHSRRPCTTNIQTCAPWT